MINSYLIVYCSPYAPSLSNGSYDGCIGLILREGSANEVVFAGEHYALNYLASEIQKGFSSTCLKTVSIVYTYAYACFVTRNKNVQRHNIVIK